MSIPSKHLLQRLKEREGFCARPYVCPAGRATIGYGHNLESNPEPIRQWSHKLADMAGAGMLRGGALVSHLEVEHMAWTEAEASRWLKKDLADVMSQLSWRCPAYIKLTNVVAAEHAGKSEGREKDMSFLGREAQVRAEVLLDMGFNLGVNGLLNFKRMLAAIQVEDYQQAASEMLSSRWAGQVGRRAVDLARQMREGVR